MGAEQTTGLAGAKGERILGLDLCRALALFGMIVVNFRLYMGIWDLGGDWLGVGVGLIGDGGVIAATFLTVAGVGLTLLWRSISDPVPLSAYRTILIRSAFLFLIGVAELPFWGLDILHSYALFFSLALAFIEARSWIIWLAIILFALAFSVLRFAIDYNTSWNWAMLTYEDLWTVQGFARQLLFNGRYPITPWFSFVLLGIWVGRRSLGDPVTRRRLLIVSVAIAAAAFATGSLLQQGNPFTDPVDGLFTTDGWPPSPLFVAAGGGTATAAIMICLEIGARWPRAQLVKVLASLGRMSLSLYVAHALAALSLEAYCSPAACGVDTVMAAVVLFYTCAALGAYLWLSQFKDGPLETLMRAIAPSPRAAAKRT